MKKYAFYLPQYHEIPENNEWWGKGFTEWVNVRKANPLYKSHKQPKVPLNNNYYSLEDSGTMKWQADLASRYGIDGMIFYHYYFSGRKLLEKPAEILIQNLDIPMKFFFCWANHSWFRTWEGSKKLLVEQTYGGETQWEEHFQYLLLFFKDVRYVKRDNKPLFMLFKSDFKEKNEYIEYLNKRCIDMGFAGISLIETFEQSAPKKLDSFQEQLSKYTEFVHLREPGTSLNALRSRPSYFAHRLANKIGKFSRKLGNSYVEIYSGEKVFKLMTNIKCDTTRYIRGLFFEWDNTPRHDYRGYLVTPPTKEMFFEYMDSICEAEYVFINAWNEWCEGMMLEPTEENQYKYLEWIKEWSEKYENRTDWI
ncbi:glycoside hydrolase family 99-like domain-containing protein [Blautia sp. JLR.GB0024]|uniref:glycosyltransferase WbsX family protein n=1 Tax=unclassified Blautia TaxID=2648079 RepID=UPI0030042139